MWLSAPIESRARTNASETKLERMLYNKDIRLKRRNKTKRPLGYSLYELRRPPVYARDTISLYMR